VTARPDIIFLLSFGRLALQVIASRPTFVTSTGKETQKKTAL
jgi:hypothetical protein